MDYSELLKSKGFSLNSYPEGKFWELKIADNEKLKQNVCKAFQADVDFLDNEMTDIDNLILQCAEDFSKCILYYDCHLFEIETNDFMHCIKKISKN